MVHAEFEYQYRKKKIFINGQVDNKTFQHIKLLQKMSQRFYFDKVIDICINLINYENEQLGSVLFVLVVTIVTQLLTHISFNQQGSLSHMILAGLLGYSFIVHIMIGKKLKFYLVVTLELVAGITLGLVKFYSFQDYSIAAYLFFTNTLILLVNLIKYLLQQQLKTKIISIFQLQSNLLILIYCIGKFLQFYLPYFQHTQSINTLNLIPTVICIGLINSLKIWSLFDFNPVHLIQILNMQHQKQQEYIQTKKYFQNILNLGKSLSNNKQMQTIIQTNQQQQHIQQRQQYKYKNQQINKQNHQSYHQNKTTYRNHDKNINVQWIQQQLQSQLSQQNKSEIISQLNSDKPSIQSKTIDSRSQVSSQKILKQNGKFQPYSNFIILAWGCNLVFTISVVLAIYSQSFNNSTLLLISFGSFKGLFLMLYCQQQSVMTTSLQTSTNKYFYILTLLIDILKSMPLLLLTFCYDLFINSQSSSQCTRFTIILHSFVPLLTTSIYKPLLQRINQTHQNTNIIHFYLIWIFGFSIRQTIISLTMKYLSSVEIYFVWDLVYMFYGVLVIVFFSKLKLLFWIANQIKVLKSMKKYKLYIMESLRNWKFDITTLSRELYFFNKQVFFIGYMILKKEHKSIIESYQCQYLIVFFSATIIHCITSFNNFYTSNWINSKKKFCYTPYYNYIIMLCLCGVYLICSYKIIPYYNIQQSSLKHQTYSLICLVLSILIILTNIFGHYIFQTFNHFRNSSKIFTLLASYFIFYYPFMTLFTIVFYGSNLNSEYLFYYAIGGFIYLTVMSIVLGIFVHAVLNLTEKSKRTLFLIRSVSQQMNHINMKQDPQFISMLENLYDLMDGKSDKLIQQLNTQKFAKIIIHDDVNIQYDYSIGQPANKQTNQQFIKIFNENIVDFNNDASKSKSCRKSLKIVSINKFSNSSNKSLKNKLSLEKKVSIISQNNNKYKLRSQILNPSNAKIENKNLIQIKRLQQSMNLLRDDQRQMKRITQLISESKQFGRILQTQQKTVQIMHRFYSFLSDPSDSISFQTFCYVFKIFSLRNQSTNVNDKFNQLSLNGNSLTQENFKSFIMEVVDKKYSDNRISIQKQNPYQIWKIFIQRQIFVMLLLKGNDIFRYNLKRKNIQISQQSTKIWTSFTDKRKQTQIAQFKKKYYLKKHKALGKKPKNMNITLKHSTKQDQQQSQIDQVILQPNQIQNHKSNLPQKKHCMFMSSDTIYTLLVNTLLKNLNDYEKTQHQHFKLQSIKFSLSNIIAILTKLFDFSYLYMYGSINALYSYGMDDFENNRYILSFINYDYFIGLAFVGVTAYILLIIYHKKQFANGSLGIDQNQRTLSLMNFKYYTTFLLFLMGSSLSNFFIMASLNSYMCDQSTLTLFNFPSNSCYNLVHYLQMFVSLLILLSYYPLASLIFPFSTAIDRTLQIKYKSQYEIIYLQCKFLTNGINVLFNQMSFQSQQLIKSVSKTIVCIILAILFHKLQPCAVDFINIIEFKIYIGLAIVNAASILCYFVGFKITVISFSVLLGLYIVYSLVSSIKVTDKFFMQKEGNNLNEHQASADKFKRQQIFKIRLKQKHQTMNNDAETVSNLYKLQNQEFYSEQINSKQPQSLQQEKTEQQMLTQSRSKDRQAKLKVKTQKNNYLSQTSNLANGQQYLFPLSIFPHTQISTSTESGYKQKQRKQFTLRIMNKSSLQKKKTRKTQKRNKQPQQKRNKQFQMVKVTKNNKLIAE